jgi:hypothetical protein
MSSGVCGCVGVCVGGLCVAVCCVCKGVVVVVVVGLASKGLGQKVSASSRDRSHQAPLCCKQWWSSAAVLVVDGGVVAATVCVLTLPMHPLSCPPIPSLQASS